MSSLGRSELLIILGVDEESLNPDELARLRRYESLRKTRDIGHKISFLGMGLILVGLIILMFIIRYNLDKRLFLICIIGAIIFAIGVIIVRAGLDVYSFPNS
ncbi:MAG TPA: hypothetical protein VK436_12055 [Methanocella sp.]|nr:hypothetical protein [Methanocella sp.]